MLNYKKSIPNSLTLSIFSEFALIISLKEVLFPSKLCYNLVSQNAWLLFLLPLEHYGSNNY